MDWRHKCRSTPNSRGRELFLVLRVRAKAAMGMRGDAVRTTLEQMVGVRAAGVRQKHHVLFGPHQVAAGGTNKR